MKKTLIMVLIAFILGLFVGFMINRFNLTGQTVKEVEYTDHTYTRAICNSQSECIDVLVECAGENVKDIEPVSDLKDFSDLDDLGYLESSGFCE
jgi:hypothetical protein